MHKEVINNISKETKDNFIILSTHDDIDVLVDGYYKYKIINIFNDLGFKAEIKNPNTECLYYAEHDIQFFKDQFHYDLHSNLCYNGLKPNSYIPIDKAFEDYCFKTKLKTKDLWKFNLSTEAEIVHLTCRIIFDKKEVPQHYKNRLEKLITKVDEKELFYAFELALFKYAKHAHKLVLNKNFEQLSTSYTACCDY
tara:strand:+ start:371 stop:955 length:585 start_codon:yes stop_codon:yes gene_type:complete